MYQNARNVSSPTNLIVMENVYSVMLVIIMTHQPSHACLAILHVPNVNHKINVQPVFQALYSSILIVYHLVQLDIIKV